MCQDSDETGNLTLFDECISADSECTQLCNDIVEQMQSVANQRVISSSTDIGLSLPL